jgi:hypothetical protein
MGTGRRGVREAETRAGATAAWPGDVRVVGVVLASASAYVFGNGCASANAAELV